MHIAIGIGLGVLVMGLWGCWLFIEERIEEDKRRKMMLEIMRDMREEWTEKDDW